jgi:non-heme chloroperoxidase
MGGGEIVRYLSRHGAKGVIKAGLVGSVAPGIVKTKFNPQGVEPSFFEGLKNELLNDKVNFFARLLKDVFYDVAQRGTFPVTKEVLDWSWQQAMQAGLQALIGSVDAFGRADFRPELSAVDVPTLLLHGTADKPVPFELTARPAAAGIRQARLIEYEGISHGLLVTERERVTRDILEFLKA